MLYHIMPQTTPKRDTLLTRSVPKFHGPVLFQSRVDTTQS